MTSELTARVAALEAKVAALEAARAGDPAPHAKAGTPPVGGGEIGYQGSVRLHGHVEWGVRYAAVSGTELPAQPAGGVLAALGHPIRVALAQRLLRGPATAAELQEAVGLSSTGQLYHHMRSLTSAGVAEQDGRGAYRVPARAVVPTLVLIVAASDVARAIATTSTG